MTIGRCFHCRHYHDTEPGVGTCEAFPEEIPLKFLLGKANHLEVVPGQVGDYVFEPTEEYAAYYERLQREIEEQERRESSS